MNCPNCGAQINDVSMKFCEVCGTELSLDKETRNILKTPSKRKHCC